MKNRSGPFDYRTLVESDRVHSRVYTDAAVFADEMEKIFHRGWVFVGHTSEVPSVGDFHLKRIGLQPVIMVRDQTGQVQLLLNRCRHRGATVCSQERGNARSFRCAYHGWSYKLDGTLAGVPYPEAYDERFRREEFGLVRVPRVAEYRGFVFGSLSPVGIALEAHLGRAREQIDLFVELSPEGEIGLSPGVQKYRFAGNWKLQVENGMDGYHPPVVHQSIVEALEKRLGRKLETYTLQTKALTRDLGDGHVMLDYRQCPGNRSLNMTTTYNGPPSNSFQTVFVDAIERRYGAPRAAEILQASGTHLLVFPNLIILGVQLRVIHPVSVDRTEVTVHPALLRGVPEEINHIRLRGHEAFFGAAGMGSPDDTEMFERMQQGFAATLEPWVFLARGKNRQRRDSDGTTVSHIMDEITQRAIWRRWKQLMTGEGGRAPASRLARSPRRRAVAGAARDLTHPS
jgi:phenylpropionate dioxygenase-like ring-hydroxylating dioxygenase large terminal subunit